MRKSWLNIEGKTVIVTGGASGIGKAVSQEFLNNGANVVVCDMSPNAPEFDFNNNSGEMVYQNIDVTNFESVKTMISNTKEKFGSIDILVNNAAYQGKQVVSHFDLKQK